MTPGAAGSIAVWTGVFAAVLSLLAYALSHRMEARKNLLIILGRAFYAAAALSVFTAMGTLANIVYHREYQYDYAVQHTSNELYNHWFRFAATWSGQEGSFLLWAFWTAVLGFVVMRRSRSYENTVMPFLVSVIGFLCAILIKQSPYLLFLKVHPGMPGIPQEGLGLNPSLQNYWMTIHPPTIFFGFASLAISFSYAAAALIRRDYDGWAELVFPYALLTCAVLGLGLFMGGYWAYETLGWHGFWAWDPVENASFFPWLAITALVHALHVQKARGNMKRSSILLGLLGFWLFLVGTFLTRSGALASKGPNGQLLSVHAFDDISKSGLVLMVAMLIGYGVVGLGLWLWRLREIPKTSATGDNLLSRDFAFFLAVLFMLLACGVITLGSTTPLFLSWLHRPPMAPQASFYNKVMIPLMVPVTILMGCVPWLAWRRTDPDTFRRKMLAPWLLSVLFGFFMLFQVQSAQHKLFNIMAPAVYQGTMHNWINPAVQRVAIVLLCTLGFLAALSNAMLAYRVFRKKPLGAGGWIAHVGIGVLLIGVLVSNTFERTQIITLKEGDGPRTVFGYTFQFVGMTGKPPAARPIDPEYDATNRVVLRVTPPGASIAGEEQGDAQTFLMQPRWYVPRPGLNEESMGNPDTMFWPSIMKYMGHDLYVALASQPALSMYEVKLSPRSSAQLGPYTVFYYKPIIDPLNFMAAELGLKTPQNKIVVADPGMQWYKDGQGHPITNDDGQPIILKVNETIPHLNDSQGRPGVVILNALNAGTHQAQLLFSLPGMPGTWNVPLSITYKPWVNLVWLGVLITVLGTLIAMMNRLRENRLQEAGSRKTAHKTA